jgi:hypothetical protein
MIHPIHRSVATRESHQSDASHDAAAIERWDAEGGAAASLVNETARKYRRIGSSEQRVRARISRRVDRSRANGLLPRA